ncbi:MAG: potassium-transporting ATPase subunit KdpC [Tepidisphaeraceae bacterium]
MRLIRPAIVSFLALTLLCGGVYPAIVTGIATVIFPGQAKGSLIVKDGKPIGSTLIAQPFTEAKYFWPRPSAASYDATASAGSNLSQTNPALVDAVRARVQALHDADPQNTQPIPVDLVTASASGLDPQISEAAAEYQAARVARARGLDVARVQQLIDADTETPSFGILGEKRVNVLVLNLQLDQLTR